MSNNVDSIVEAKLYAWAEWRQTADYPDIDVGSRYRRMKELKQVGIAPRATANDGTSPQEAWAVSRQRELHDAAIIERTVEEMPWFDRWVVWLKYIRGARWTRIAWACGKSRASIYRDRRRIIDRFADALKITT